MLGVLILPVLAACSSCVAPFGKQETFAARGVLALTFDDRNSMESWIAALPLFDRYNAHATFFINGHFDAKTVRLARELAAHGHTIGLHGLNHKSATRWLAAGGTIDDYIRDEIEPQQSEAAASGFAPLFWAYPGNHRNDITDRQVGILFRRMRSGGSMSQATLPIGGLASKAVEDRTFHSLALYPTTDYDRLDRHLEEVAASNLFLSTFSHRIMESPNAYGISPAQLERILRRAQELGIRVLGFSELGE